MTIEEAIKILEDKDGAYSRSSYEERLTAKGLGIEAMKYIQAARTVAVLSVNYPLPGETKE